MLEKRIQYHFKKSKQLYGSSRVTEELLKEGHMVSSKTVSRLMKKLDLKSRTVRKYKATTNSISKRDNS
ncbi:IS3 family transposase [Paenibacillus alginolyticus]|uniref:IS3 family transposase n=1 Tax=Paenibacillus alginolyticus TaxID=59839 RepID=UPI0015670D25